METPLSGQLPAGIAEELRKTRGDKEDKIADLQGDLQTTQDALDSAQERLKDVEAENKILKDNDVIKKSAFAYAKAFMIIIPALCFLVIVLSSTKGFSFTIFGMSFSAAWDIQINDYAQAAFVVAPIIFVATVLGFLLKGVFGQASASDEANLAALGRIIAGQAK